MNCSILPNPECYGHRWLKPALYEIMSLLSEKSKLEILTPSGFSMKPLGYKVQRKKAAH